jgi:5-methylcytosine-specific restriction endonuclease McrA
MPDYSIKRYSSYSDAELLESAQRVAAQANSPYLSSRAFTEVTGIAEATIASHFGSWAKFCTEAGLAPRYERAVSRERFFENLEHIWNQLGRQPRAKEMKQPLSPISVSRYQKEFAAPWYSICLQFLSWKSGASISEIEQEALSTSPAVGPRRSTRREVTLSLRYAVLKRGAFRCAKCGASPATNPAVQLHVDHVVSWANGGETVLENLQCLCSECNLGKSNRHDG